MKLIKFFGITLLFSGILYFLMFEIFIEFTNYYLCTRIENFSFDTTSQSRTYTYTRSCDEEPYFAVLKNFNNLYTLEDFQYQNRPIFLVLAWFIFKIVGNLNLNDIFLFQFSFFLLQNIILCLVVYLFNQCFNIKNNFLNFTISLIFISLSPIYKWTLFEAGHHTQTGLLILLGVYFASQPKKLTNFFIPLLIGILYLSHRSFIVLFVYAIYLIISKKLFDQNKYKQLTMFIVKFLIPIISYELFKNILNLGKDHNIEIYNQFFWVFDFLRGFDTYGVTGWYCQNIPQNFKCYLQDNLNVIKYLYIPFLFLITYVIFNKTITKYVKEYRSLFEIVTLVFLFWSLIGWYPPVRFSFYSLGHLIIFLSAILFYKLENSTAKSFYMCGYVLYFLFLNHYNGDIYFENNPYLFLSVFFYFLAFIINQNSLLKRK
tara:strand:- start:2360 stop:3649 length:1290 start_codon:yes stop_codon:yes gene_type:complete